MLFDYLIFDHFQIWLAYLWRMSYLVLDYIEVAGGETCFAVTLTECENETICKLLL